MNALPLAILLSLAAPRSDSESEAIAALKVFEPTITREETKPGKPVVAILFHANANKKPTDDELAPIAKLTQLRSVELHSSVTDNGVEHLKPFTKLRELSLMSTKVGDAGLEQLKGFTTLEYLDLDYTPITDAGVKHLAGLRELRSL